MKPDNKRSSQPTVTDDRRREERHATNLLSCQIGKVVDVSFSGMKLQGQGKPPVKVGQVVVTKLDAGSQRISVQAQILWIRRRGFKSYTLGVRFLNMKRGLKMAVESLARFGYVDLEAAAQKSRRKVADKPDVKRSSGDPGYAQKKVNESGEERPKLTITATLDLPDYYTIIGVRVDASIFSITSSIQEAFPCAITTFMFG